MSGMITQILASTYEIVRKEVARIVPVHRWATVVSISPLRIRFDDQTQPLAATPGKLVSGLQIGDRVDVRHRSPGQPLITGIAGGAGHDTGWRDFSWTDSYYVNNPEQSAYTLNKWMIKNDTLHVPLGFGVPTDLNSSAEIEIARVPITGAFPMDSQRRYWMAGVGGGGVIYGFIAYQTATHISFYIKSHTSTIGTVGRWASTTFTIPLQDGWSHA